MSQYKVPSRLRRELQKIAPGWSISLSRNNHVRLQHPKGPVAFASLTSSDHRARRNLAALIRRIERELDGSQDKPLQ